MSDTRTILLDLGENAVRTRGYAGFSYADLARDAGIRKASIHHHFPAKADLAVALVERYSDGLADWLADISRREESASGRMREAIALYRSAMGDGERMCLCAALSTDVSLLPEAAMVALDRANRATASWFAEVFELAREDGSIALPEGSDAQREGLTALALLQGAQLVARAAGSTDRFDAATATLFQRISG